MTLLISKLHHVGTTIPLGRDTDVFTVTSKLNQVRSREAGQAAECGAIDLSQGFPDLPSHTWLNGRKHPTMKAGNDQCMLIPA